MNTIAIMLLLSRWVHILSAIVAVGGAFFVRFALMPAAKAALAEEDHDRLRSTFMPFWTKVAHTCVGLLLVTGAFNFYVTFVDGVKPIPYHPIFGLKLIMALFVFFLAIALTGTSPGFASFRANAKKWLSVYVFLAVCIVLLSGVLKLIHQTAMIAPPTG